jgi:hypothetical protein
MWFLAETLAKALAACHESERPELLALFDSMKVLAEAHAKQSEAELLAMLEVRKRTSFNLRCHLILKAISFYQDRLGTNIRKSTPKRDAFFAG